MKKTWLTIGALGAVTSPIIATISCGLHTSKKDVQKDVDRVLKAFTDAKISINNANAITQATDQIFNKSVLTNLSGNIQGTYPTIAIPQDVKITYSVAKIDLGSSGKMLVTIAKKGAISKTFEIDISTKNIPANPAKDVQYVLDVFQKANLILNPQNSVKAASGVFNVQALQNMGGYQGVYPSIKIPQGVSINYTVANIDSGHTGNLTVTISKPGTKAKKFNILVDVTRVKLVNVNSEQSAKVNMKYDASTKTLTIGDKVGEINYDLSSIWDIEHINWGHKPRNILKIGEKAFFKAQLTSLDLTPLSNLTIIGKGAFSQSRLTTVDFAGLTNLTQIGGAAFSNAQLQEINLSGLTSLKNIGWAAFTASDPNSINLSGLNNLTTIGQGAFGLATVNNIDWSSLTSLTTIGEEAFYNCTFTKLDLSILTDLTTIGAGAFHNSPLMKLNLANLFNLTAIGNNAFASIQPNMQLNMDQTNYTRFIHDQASGLDNQNAIFGPNSSSINLVHP